MKTLTEAAQIVGTTADNLRGAIHRRSLRARKVGPIWTVSDQELARYLRENRQTTRKVES